MRLNRWSRDITVSDRLEADGAKKLGQSDKLLPGSGRPNSRNPGVFQHVTFAVVVDVLQ